MSGLYVSGVWIASSADNFFGNMAYSDSELSMNKLRKGEKKAKEFRPILSLILWNRTVINLPRSLASVEWLQNKWSNDAKSCGTCTLKGNMAAKTHDQHDW